MLSKINVKKIFSVLLAVLMLLPAAGSFAAKASAETDYAIIYVRGSTGIYKFNSDGTKYKLYDDGDYLSAIMSQAAPLLPNSMFTGDYDEYAKKVLEIMTPAYDAFRPSLTDGSVPEDTGVNWSWSRESIEDIYDSGSNIFQFYIDERLSPFVEAAELNSFVQTVKEVTEKDKILLYSRCLGPVVALTYLYEYERANNFANVTGVVLSFSTHNGMALTDALFTGNVNIPSEALSKWMTSVEFSDDSLDAQTVEVIRRLLNSIANSYGTTLTASTANKLYAKLKYNLFKPLLKEYYALQLLYTACVNEKYDDMIKYLFSDAGDSEKYAYALGEMKRYHENVYPAINGMLSNIKSQGKNLLIFADYGGQQYPLNEESEYIGDYQVGTKSQSFGAVTAKIDQTLSADYIAKQQAAGLGKYISPDKKIDASTAKFRDNTFFISNLDHKWPARYMAFELALAARDNFDINSDSSVPQFMVWDEDNNRAVKVANVEVDSGNNGSGQNGISQFFKKIVDFFRNIIQKIINFFS